MGFHVTTLAVKEFSFGIQPKPIFSKVLLIIKTDKKIQSIWDEKRPTSAIHKDEQVGVETTSLNRHILKRTSSSNPLSLMRSAFCLACGSFPFIG